MSIESAEWSRQIQLRKRAASKLGNLDGQSEARLSSTAALRVLHSLASSPASAADAIALLHELQVHQVELDLQYEELQSSNSDLEADLERQTELFDHAPVALYALDAALALIESNLAGARLLGQDRQALIGQPLTQFLTSNSRSPLQVAMERIRAGRGIQSCALELTRKDAPSVIVHASLNANPAAAGFLLALWSV